MRPGFYTADKLSNADYHSGPGVSNSGLKLISEQTPAHFYARNLAPDRPKNTSTQAQMIGTAMHAAALEPDLFEREYVIAPFDRRNAAGYKAWREGEEAMANRHILLPQEADLVVGMRASLFAHRTAGALLRDAYAFEHSCYASDPETGELVRIRMDLLTHSGFIVDLKKTQSVSDQAISKALANWDYYQQDAFYTDVMAWSGAEVEGFAFVFVEEQPPHMVRVVFVDPDDQDRGRGMYRRALNIYHRCMESGHWPGYGDDFVTLGLPYWKRREIDNLLEG